MSRSVWVIWVGLVAFFSCVRSVPEAPQWWSATPTGATRSELIGRSLGQAAQAEATPPYYSDSLGLVFRQSPPAGGTLWIEYWPDTAGNIQTLTLTWEHPEFARLAALYQTVRRHYETLYGPSMGAVGNQQWTLPGGRHLRLHLSPERRYLQLTCWRSRTFEP